MLSLSQAAALGQGPEALLEVARLVATTFASALAFVFLSALTTLL